MRVLAIDPGTTQSAALVWDGATVSDAGIWPNRDLRDWLNAPARLSQCNLVAIEMVACYGMAVGASVFETCVWIGRFCERAPFEPRMIFRRDVKLHHCGSARTKDANVRQALIDKYGAPGTKRAPGVTYRIKSHLWAAFAIATYVVETELTSRQIAQSPFPIRVS